jgi:hydroxyacylglutathione hydrolase
MACRGYLRVRAAAHTTEGNPERQLFGGKITFTEPDDVLELADNAGLSLAGLDLTVSHVPGHTEGSVTFRGQDQDERLDLLFAGSIGRTDLPGGDHRKMIASLARTLTLPDETVVRPGHGPRPPSAPSAPPTRS